MQASHLPAVGGEHGVRPAGHGAQRLRRGPHGKGDLSRRIHRSPANATSSSQHGHPKRRAQRRSGCSPLMNLRARDAPRLESRPLDSHTHKAYAAQRFLQAEEQELIALRTAACAAPKGVPLHMQCLVCAAQRAKRLAQLPCFQQSAFQSSVRSRLLCRLRGVSDRARKAGYRVSPMPCSSGWSQLDDSRPTIIRLVSSEAAPDHSICKRFAHK